MSGSRHINNLNRLHHTSYFLIHFPTSPNVCAVTYQESLGVCLCSNSDVCSSTPPHASHLLTIKFIPSYLLPSGLCMVFSLLFFLLWIKGISWIVFQSAGSYLFSGHWRLCWFSFFFFSQPCSTFLRENKPLEKVSMRHLGITYCNKICWLNVQIKQLQKHSGQMMLLIVSRSREWFHSWCKITSQGLFTQKCDQRGASEAQCHFTSQVEPQG